MKSSEEESKRWRKVYLRRIKDVGNGDLIQTLKSLILAQDERWRHA